MNEEGKRNGDFAPTGLKPDGQWHDEDQYRGNNSRPHLSHKDCHNKWNAESNQMKKRLQAKNDRLSEIYESMAEPKRRTWGIVAVDNDKTGMASPQGS
jgi:hypothetical protein